MRNQDVAALFDFNYWANRQILAAASAIPIEQLIEPPSFTYRSLHGTLLHTLDVEWSWRIRLRGELPELWDTSLADDDYPTIDAIAGRWTSDELEMREWLSELTDEELRAVADAGTEDRFPLWFYLVHIVTHSEQQRRDSQMLLRSFGVEPPELEFLWYADTLAAS